MQERDTGDASKTPAPARLPQPPVQHGAEEQALQPSAAGQQNTGAELMGKVPKRINLAAISSADMPSAKRHHSSHPAVHQDKELQQGLQQVPESHVAHSISAVETQVQHQQREGQNSKEAQQFLEEVFREFRQQEQPQAIPEQVLEGPEHVEQPTEERQQVQEALQLSPPEGELPQQQALQPQGKRQRSPENEQQPAANEQQPAADDEQPARTDSAALQLADQSQAVQHAPASHGGTGASSPRAALSPKRRRRVCFAHLEGVTEVRGSSSEQGDGASGAQEGAVTEVLPVNSYPAMVSSTNR